MSRKGAIGFSMPFRKKKNLFAVMQLNESVADTVYDVIASKYDNDEERGAIVKADDTYLVVAVMEADIEEAMGGSKAARKSEEAGTFSASINSDIIDAIVIPEDMENGILGLIPSVDTMQELYELSFIDSTPLHIAAVTKDFNEEDGLTVFDTTVTLDDLTNIQNGHQTLQLSDDGESVALIDYDASANEEEEPFVEEDVEPVSDEPNEPVESVNEEPDVQDEPTEAFDEPTFVAEEPEYEAPIVEPVEPVVPESSYEAEPVYQPAPVTYQQPVAPIAPQPVYQPEPDVANADDLVDIQAKIMSNLNSDQLMLDVTADEFDNVYSVASHPVELFSEEVQNPNSSLDIHVAQMAAAANTRSLQFIDSSVNSLRSDYLLTLRAYADNLQKTLDYTDESTAPGKKRLAIKQSAEEKAIASMAEFEEKKATIQAEYDARKQKAVDEAIARAENEFDRENGDELKRALEFDSAAMQVEIDLFEEKELKQLHQQRRDFAQKAYASAVTKLLLTYRERIEDVYRQQIEMFNDDNNRMNEYIEKNYSNEIMRANAVQQELDRKQDLQSLEDKYATQMAAKDVELENLRKKSEADLKEVRDKADFDVQKVENDMHERVATEQSLNAKLRDDLSELTTKYASLEDKKDEEYRHRLAVQEDRAKSLEDKLDQYRRDDEAASRNRGIVMALVALLTLLLGAGITFGVMHAVNVSTASQSQSEISRLKDSLSDAKARVNEYKSSAEIQSSQISDLQKVVNDLKTTTQPSNP